MSFMQPHIERTYYYEVSADHGSTWIVNPLNGLHIYTCPETGAVYIPLPKEQWGSSAWTDSGPCHCGKCDGSGKWDTLVIPGHNDKQPSTFTIHCPELQTGTIPHGFSLVLGRR